MRDRDDGLLAGGGVLRAAHAADQLVVAGLEAALDADRRPGGLHKRRLDVGAGVADAAVAALAGADVVPGARPAAGEFSCVANHWCGAGPISAIQVQAVASPNPWIVFSRAIFRSQAAALAAICTSTPATAVFRALTWSMMSRHIAA